MTKNSVMWAVSTALIMSQSLLAQPSLPKDLENLFQDWQAIPFVTSDKDQTSLSIGMGSFSAEANGIDRYKDELAILESKNTEDKILHINSGLMGEKAQSEAIDRLFVSSDYMPRFCSTIAQKPIKIPPRTNYSETEKAAMQFKADLANCKKTFRDAMGGIFNAGTTVQFFQATYAKNPHQGELTFWIYSIADENIHLKYQFSF
jgi:hypothetical protein